MTISSAIILNIETSTKNCSVSIHNEIKMINQISRLSEKYLHSETLTTFIDSVITASNLSFSDIDAVAVSKGPGSYTGLRIGVSTAKGICYGVGVPLISVCTLQSMARYIAMIHPGYDMYCPMIDARRDEVFSAFYDNSNRLIRDVRADIIDSTSYTQELRKKVLFFGDGSTKVKDIVKSDNAFFLENIYPYSYNMADISFEKYNNKDFEDIAYFEPFYLKDFLIR